MECGGLAAALTYATNDNDSRRRSAKRKEGPQLAPVVRRLVQDGIPRFLGDPAEEILRQARETNAERESPQRASPDMYR
jgi:hypothetical protein